MMIENEIIIPKNTTEQLLYTTVRISGLTHDNKTTTGTGFFFKIQLNDGRHVSLILTNKHVINGNKELTYHLHEGIMKENEIEPSGKFIPVLTKDFSTTWTPHPDENV